MASNKKVSQKDLRQMMKERKAIQSQTQTIAKIESPLARYDSSGHLSCLLCDIQIKSHSLWSQHIIGTVHKNKLEEMKRKKVNQKLNEENKKNNNNMKINTNIESKREANSSLKRKLDENESEMDLKIANKLTKNNTEVKNEDIYNNSREIISSNKGLESSLSSVNCNLINSEVKQSLPNDFFDNPNEKNVENTPISSEDIVSDIDLSSNSLPKGFFDDPVMDAKARHVPFKDPIDEEWDRFQKAMAEEVNTSQMIIEEEVEEIQVDRTLVEIEEQISSWAKVEELQKNAQYLHLNPIQNNYQNNKESESSDSSDDIDDQEINVFSNWRSRGALNSK